MLVDYFRRKDKMETRLYQLSLKFEITVPSIVAYEYLRGQKNKELDTFLHHFLSSAATLPFDFACAQKAAEIWQNLKSTGKSIEPEDLFIAATALVWGYPLATNNLKHFDHIPGIRFV